MKEALLAHADIQPGMEVLDLASGTGDPAITIAGLVEDGHVTASDLSPAMLEACTEHAREAGLTNLTCQQADAESLPFADDSFDRVTSRLGIMYFVDVQTALAEIMRVLKPGGVATFLVWDSPRRALDRLRDSGYSCNGSTRPRPRPTRQARCVSLSPARFPAS